MKHSTAIEFQHLALRLVTSLMCAMFIHGANAAEVYKWTDANGQVHFGDRLSAPANGKQIDVKVSPAPEQRELPKPRQSGIPLSQPPLSIPANRGNSKPADPSKVRPGCQELIDQISKVKPGTNWQSLYQKFDANCPGIAYECNTYRTHPENNRCTWIERSGNNIMKTNNYE